MIHMQAKLTNIIRAPLVTCTITGVNENGLDVLVGENLTGFIRRADLSRERSEQRTERFAVDEKVDAIVTQFDKKTRGLTLSIKAREIEEEKSAMENFGSSDSGASLEGYPWCSTGEKEDSSISQQIL